MTPAPLCSQSFAAAAPRRRFQFIIGASVVRPSIDFFFFFQKRNNSGGRRAINVIGVRPGMLNTTASQTQSESYDTESSPGPDENTTGVIHYWDGQLRFRTRSTRCLIKSIFTERMYISYLSRSYKWIICMYSVTATMLLAFCLRRRWL